MSSDGNLSVLLLIVRIGETNTKGNANFNFNACFYDFFYPPAYTVSN